MPVHPIDRAIELLLAGLIVFGPATWGVVEAWSFQIVQTMAAAVAALLLLRLFVQRSAPPVMTWAYLPVVLMLAWILMQVVPLPQPIVEAASPLGASFWVDALGEQARWMPFSMYPLATERMFAALLVASVVFVAAAQVYRTTGQVVRLLILVVMLGVTVGGLGVAQTIFGGDRVYWIVPPTHGNSGPFMNHNHYAQFLNLTIAGAVGLLLALRGGGVWRHLGRLVLAAIVLGGAVAVALSWSRAGFGALAAATIVGAIALQRTWAGVVRALLILLLGGILVGGAAVYLAGGGALKRISDMSLASELESERVTIWRGAARMFEQFPITGAGLGSFEFVYPVFADWGRHRVTHADSDYLQLLAECGVPGAITVAGFVVLLGARWWRLRRGSNSADARTVVAQVLGLGVLAVLLHSATDFGQRLPGIAVLTATYCGIIVAASVSFRQVEPPAAARAWRRHRLTLATGVVAALGLFAWTLVTADRDRRAEDIWSVAEVRRDELNDQRWKGPNAQYAALIATAAEAVSIQPRDARRQYWLAIFRWRSISRESDRRGFVLTTERTRDIARRIADDFVEMTKLCPSTPAPWLMAARLELLVLGEDSGREHAARAARRHRVSGPKIEADLLSPDAGAGI